MQAGFVQINGTYHATIKANGREDILEADGVKIPYESARAAVSAALARIRNATPASVADFEKKMLEARRAWRSR